MAAAVTIFQGSVTPVFEVGLGLEKTTEGGGGPKSHPEF
jgi:hypothetical protein